MLNALSQIDAWIEAASDTGRPVLAEESAISLVGRRDDRE